MCVWVISWLSLFAAYQEPISFRENLRFGGADQGENFIWSSPKSVVSSDADGNMYVSDPGDQSILVFSSEGVFVRRFGRQGQGPGEFTGLVGFTSLDQGGGVAFTNDRGFGGLHRFDAEGVFVEVIAKSAPAIVSPDAVSPDGRHVFATRVLMPSGASLMSVAVGISDMEWNMKHTVGAVDRMAPNPERFNERTFWVEFLASALKAQFGGNALVAFDSKSRVYTADSHTFSVVRWDDGFVRASQVYKRSVKPNLRTTDEIDGLLSEQTEGFKSQLPPNLAEMITPNLVREAWTSAGISEVKPYLIAVIPMSDGGLLAVRDVSKDGEASYDIFDGGGAFVGSGAMAANLLIDENQRVRMHFRDGQAYTLTEDDEGDFVVIRYEVKLKP